MSRDVDGHLGRGRARSCFDVAAQGHRQARDSGLEVLCGATSSNRCTLLHYMGAPVEQVDDYTTLIIVHGYVWYSGESHLSIIPLSCWPEPQRSRNRFSSTRLSVALT
ncbi:hypothetical protein BD310DRAFT_936347 [Dichomitus squalens]|uniref:Uncharacterized protein n=1 Tax=Dichomitus squalens TaxID=114155 RepID=A0A4V2K701_9APHY|nr:hypothetical protein BD310DRAFT_936347 [Dichomitus squalens]